MGPTIQIAGRYIPFSSAVQHDSDVLARLEQDIADREFNDYLYDHIPEIESQVRHHFGTSTSIQVSARPEWKSGSFNVCIPVEIGGSDGPHRTKVLMRYAKPHAMSNSPGSIDEKISCEVATYAFIQDRCPEIPIPILYGFSFSSGRTYTHAAYRSVSYRAYTFARRFASRYLGLTQPSWYTQHPSTHSLKTGYLLLEYIKEGRMLSTTFDQHLSNPGRRATFFRDLSRIILSLARLPQPRIGSFNFQDDGTIHLTNRPLTASIAIMERRGAVRVIEPNTTYTAVDPYVADLLTYHDNRFISQPNAISNRGDGEAQMTVKAFLRAVSHHYLRRDLRNGPFILCLTDLHASNIFVDDTGHITKLFDLEWVCSLPIQMEMPYQVMTDRGIDQFNNDQDLEVLDSTRMEFLGILSEEEASFPITLPDGLSLSRTLDIGWHSGTFWYYNCLTSINAMYNLFYSKIAAGFSFPDPIEDSTARKIFSHSWSRNSEHVLQKKLADKREYDANLQQSYIEAGA